MNEGLVDPLLAILLLSSSSSTTSAESIADVLPRLTLPIVCMYLVMGFVISWDWRSFVARHRVKARPVGRAHTAITVKMGWNPVSFYRNAVRLIFTEEGIYFFVWLPFRLFHAPFLLPWESVRRVEKKDSFLLGQSIHVDVSDPAGTMHVWLRKSVEQDLLKYFLALREPLPPSVHTP